MYARHAWLILVGLLACSSAEARNFELRGDNELGGGIGFAAPFSTWSPGGFKWFNDYSHKLGRITWLNLQLNLTVGDWDHHGGHCHYDNRGRLLYCDDDWGWDGYDLQFAIGVKLKWRLRKIPLQFHAKFGGTIDGLFFPEYHGVDDRVQGVAFGFRGGFGVRYFFVPTFGLGAEFIPTFGPAYVEGHGAEFYGTFDFNTGVEWLF